MLVSVLPGNIWMISKTFKKILCGLTRQHFFTPLYVWVMSVHHWGSWENNNSSSSKSQINFKTTQIVWEIIESLFLMHILQLLYILLWSIFFTKWYLFIRDGFSSFPHVGEARGGWCQHFSEQRRHCDRKEVHGCSWFTDWEDHGCQHHGSLLGQSVKDMDKSPHDFTSRLDNTVIFNLALTSPVDSLVEFKNEYDLFCYSRWFGLFPPPLFFLPSDLQGLPSCYDCQQSWAPCQHCQLCWTNRSQWIGRCVFFPKHVMHLSNSKVECVGWIPCLTRGAWEHDVFFNLFIVFIKDWIIY